MTLLDFLICRFLIPSPIGTEEPDRFSVATSSSKLSFWTCLIISLSALSNSSGVIGSILEFSVRIRRPVLRCSTAFRNLTRKRSIHAKNFFKRNHEEKYWKMLFIDRSLTSVDARNTSVVFLTSGSPCAPSGTGQGRIGQVCTGCQRKSGPLSHRLLFVRASAERPREASSAGFCSELT